MGSTTRIDSALRMVQDEMYEEVNGARKDVPKILILLTDGSQTQAPDAEDPGNDQFFMTHIENSLFVHFCLQESILNLTMIFSNSLDI